MCANSHGGMCAMRPGSEHRQLQPSSKNPTPCAISMFRTMVIRTFAQSTMLGSSTATRSSLCIMSCRLKVFHVDYCDYDYGGDDGVVDQAQTKQRRGGLAWPPCLVCARSTNCSAPSLHLVYTLSTTWSPMTVAEGVAMSLLREC